MRHALAGAALLCAAVPVAAQDDLELETALQKFSYGVGLQIASQLRQQGLTTVDAAALAAAIDDVIVEGRRPRITIEELQAAQAEVQQEIAMAAAKRATEARAAGEMFLAKNGKRDGVTTTDSGLQYEVLEAGSGDSPVPEDTVVVHYSGKLLDGTEFDSSHRRGEPATFQVGGVIKGWQEALSLMSPGAKWQVWIPADLAYGDNGAGPRIGPGETLAFEIELLSVQE